MNPLNATFEDYQAQYETVLPLNVRNGLTYVQVQIHYVVTVIDGVIQFPDIVLRTTQLAVAVFSFVPPIAPALEMPKQFCKDAKNLINVIKGLKSIDGFLEFKLSWQPIVMNISGITLLIVSALSLIERVNWVDVHAIKVFLTAIPIFGSLPYGGLLPFSIAGLMGMTACFGSDKRSKLIKDEAYIKNEKFVFWSHPLDLNTVQQRQAKYETRVLNLQAEIAAYEELIEDGKQVQDELDEYPDQAHRVYACQKALEELSAAWGKKVKDLSKSKEKASQWSALGRDWNQINLQELEDFRQAKYAKWEAKLDRIQLEKKANFIAITNNVIIFSRQALVIISVAMGYGIVTLPLIVNVGLDGTVAGCGLATFCMKRSIKKIKIPRVNLDKYVHFNMSPTPENFGDIEKII